MRPGRANMPASASLKKIANRDARPRDFLRGGDGDCVRRLQLATCQSSDIGQTPVDDVNSAARAIRDLFVVRDDHERQAFFVQLFEQIEQVGRCFRIQVAGRLVAKQQARRTNKGPGNRHALLFAAGELGRQEVGAVAEADPLDRRQCPGFAVPRGCLPIDFGQHHVFETVRYGSRWNDWKTKPMRWLRRPARWPSLSVLVSMPSNR